MYQSTSAQAGLPGHLATMPLFGGTKVVVVHDIRAFVSKPATGGLARKSVEADFSTRHGLDASSLLELFAWSEDDFEQRTAGSAIRRIGYDCWLRNVAVALGNAPRSAAVAAALRARRDEVSEMVREHIAWALERQDGQPGHPSPP